MKNHTFRLVFHVFLLILPRKYDKSYSMNLGKIIKDRRAVLGISQQDLSDYSGVGISTVKDLERGIGNPSIVTLQKILDVVGLEMVLQVKQTIK